MGRQPRQRPVSCHFCRVRKLRCSREFPCSNCTSRGVQCQSQDPPRLTPAVTTTASVSRPIAKRGDAPPTDREADILSRLERLEALLAEKNNQTDSNTPTASTASSSNYGNDAVPGTRTQTQPPEPPRPLPANVQNLTADALWLERTCLGPKPSVSQYYSRDLASLLTYLSGLGASRSSGVSYLPYPIHHATIILYISKLKRSFGPTLAGTYKMHLAASTT
jgi:hypothetical protein